MLVVRDIECEMISQQEDKEKDFPILNGDYFKKEFTWKWIFFFFDNST